MLRKIVLGVFALALPVAASASAVLQSASGEVQAGGVPLTAGQRIFPGTVVTTGQAAQATLRFDDGMQIVLDEGTHLRLLDFRYTPPRSSSSDRAVLELIQGAARVVTGRIAAANAKEFYFRTPQTELQVEMPSDFTVALVNPAYVSVRAGQLTSANGWGTQRLTAGSTNAIANRVAAPVVIQPAALPPSAAAATTKLAAAGTTPVAGGVSTGAGAAASTGAGFALPGVAAAAAALGIGIAAANSNSRSPVSHAVTHP